MVTRTLGKEGARVASATYIFLHYALLVAYISRASQSISATTGQPAWLTAVFFSTALAGLCYAASPRLLDVANTVLLALVVLSFLSLLWFALPGVNLENLQSGSWPAVIDTLPVVALAFVYQNVVPVVVTNLEGDVRKVRLAIWTGLAVPLVMFIGWEGAMLGSIAPGVLCCRL
jgi:tyrosine-specific transport protein